MIRRCSPPRPADARASRRGGFSLIELLIVITIIAILAGLLLGGVQSAMGRVRVAAAVSEIKHLEKAIKDFNNEFGVDPPSFIVLYESTTSDVNGWNTANVETRNSRAIIRQLWKDFQFGSAAAPMSVDINGDGDTTDTLRLNGAECLVFFLGGLIDKGSGVAVAKGFSKVSASPFGSLAGALGSRSGPFYDTFEAKQFVDLDGDGMLEYMDSIPGQSRPIQYFSSYGGTGYRPLGRNGTYDGTASGSDDEVLPETLQWVYTKSAGTATKAAEPYNPNGFQLVSPGLNGEFCGALSSGSAYEGGGYLKPETGVVTGATYVVVPPASPTKTINRDAQSAVLERDNITNFSGGEIH
jgi:prepilin-type N-terminal cleavage/methylation domain-containing protein